jgi:putative tricarboxylic transport membrane protein
MAMKGQAGKALGVAILTSFIGGMLSFGLLMSISPILANYALKFGPFEYFSVGVFSLTLIGSVLGGSIIKSLAAAFLGMCLSYIGMGPISSVPRLTFGCSTLRRASKAFP